MKELKFTKQFKKDLKRIQNNSKRIACLKGVLKILQETGTLNPIRLQETTRGIWNVM